MSARDDATLSARERADLANLEARAEADDPFLAARLRGRGLQLLDHLPHLPARLRSRWWGPVIAVIGLALGVLGLSTSLALGVLGLVVAAVGLWLTATAVEAKLVARAARPEPPE